MIYIGTEIIHNNGIGAWCWNSGNANNSGVSISCTIELLHVFAIMDYISHYKSSSYTFAVSCSRLMLRYIRKYTNANIRLIQVPSAHSFLARSRLIYYVHNKIKTIEKHHLKNHEKTYTYS